MNLFTSFWIQMLQMFKVDRNTKFYELVTDPITMQSRPIASLRQKESLAFCSIWEVPIFLIVMSHFKDCFRKNTKQWQWYVFLQTTYPVLIYNKYHGIVRYRFLNPLGSWICLLSNLSLAMVPQLSYWNVESIKKSVTGTYKN